MKKIYYLAMAIATMVSCQNENDVLVVQEEVSNKTFTASFENNSSRTALQGEENNVVWLENDLLSIFSGKSINKPFVLTKGENTTYGEFEPTSISAGTENNTSTGLSLSANVGYYPYDANVTVAQAGSAYEINATFPTEQTFSTSGTFGNGASPMVAVTSSTFDTELKFKNVGAIFRLQLQGTATITHVVFSADANLAGNCAITASNTSVPTVQVIKGSNTIVLDCGEGVQLSENEATNFVVAMLPVEISTGGITITIYDNAGKKMVYTHKETEPITIERSKAYTTAEVTYEGNKDANTQLGVQAALDAATTGTTIQLEPGVNYGTLVFRQNADSKYVDINDIGGDAKDNEKFSSYENITIIGAPGAVVDQIDFQVGWGKDERYPSHASYIAINNLTIKNVTFSGTKTAINLDSSKGSNLGIDGLTIDGCTMNDADGADRFVFQQISGYKQLADKSTSESVMTTGVKNLTIKNCSVTGAYQVIETREMENLSITNNTIKNTTKHAMLLAVNTGKTYSGNVTITGNTADGINERFVRMAGAGTANVVINNNVITNYKGADADCIKVTDRTTTGTIDTKNNTFEVSTAATLQATLDAATEGTIINLVPNVNYGVVYMGRPTKSNNTEMFCETHNYTTTNADDFIAHLAEGGYHTTPRYTTTLKNLTINGATGATIEGLVATSGHAYGDVYDYVLEKDYASGSAYYLTLNISSVKFSKVNFTGKIDINTSDETSVYDGITFDQCTFTTGGTASTNGAAIRYYNEANNGNVKNIKVQNCTFTNCYQGIYVHHVNGITVTSNSFTTTGHNAIAIQSHTGSPVNLKDVVITNNTFNNIADRVIRFNEIGANSNITIQGNTATNSGDDANEVMKATTIASGVTTSISGNNWGDGAVVANDELKDK